MPRPLNQQVIVITGASSGIGREAAIRLGGHGATVVLVARNRDALTEVERAVRDAGGKALATPADVGDAAALKQVADETVARFGRIDTWINNAGLYYAGPVESMSIDEIDQIVRVNLLGQIYGVKAALPHFIAQGSGGFINVSSGLAVRSTPLTTLYSTTKRAVRGFTEGLRVELEHEHPGITVSEILPASINTPLFAHARSGTPVKPRPIPPVYDTSEVARAIEHVAEHPLRDVYIGPMRGLAVLEGLMPGALDRVMRLGGLMHRAQQSDEPVDGRDNFYAPMPADTYASDGEWGAETHPISVTTRMTELRPWGRAAVMGAFTLGAVALVRRQRDA
jgi:NAD(P)-dependent dehydrogenase (short-subunit alcohol dehydrogenase family)